jgi:UDP-N-acetylmuramate dehydrogenase
VLNGSPNLKSDLRSVRENGEPEVHERVDLRAWTNLGVGGIADLLVRCRSADGLQRALDVFATHGQSWLVLGAGSRLVPPDRGLRVPILNLSGNLGLWELDLDGAVAGGGASLAQVCRAAARTGLAGAESLAATSSSVGGAIQAAATTRGALDGWVDWIELARPGSPVKKIRIGERRERLADLDLDLERNVVLRARFQLVGERAKGSRVGRGDHDVYRLQRQPRSAEPFFVDPPGAPAQVVLRDARCLDLMVGGARFSRSSGNRICTSRTARSTDVLELTRLVRDQVAARADLVIEPALCFVDEDGRTLEL